MKTQIPLGSASVTAASALTKNLFIGFDGALCGASAKSLGVSDTGAACCEQIPVIISGIALVLSGGSFSRGSAVTSNSAGKAVAATAFSVTVPSGATQVTSSAAQPNLVEAGSVLPESINGYALDESTGSDQLIRILLV
jgi:hypothetical protein